MGATIEPMPTRVRPRPAVRLIAAALLAVVAFAGVAIPPAGVPTAAGLSRWDGSVDLYRAGVFTTQRSWLWCTAADVQIMRNIVHRQADHTTSGQRRYFDYMRAHNRYRIPVSDGVDPAGWTAGLRRYVDSRYRLVSSGSFDAALRSAVTNLRKTNLPVGITVSHGGHAWILVGFSATADPAVTTRFTVTSVRVVGPLWGLQSRSYGYDMRPNRNLTVRQLRGFFTPWHYARVRMAWEGRWVSIQPIPTTSTSTAAAAPKPTPTPRPSASPSPSPSPSPSSVPSAAAPPLPSPGSSGGAGVAVVPPPVGPSAAAEPTTSEPVGSSASALGPPFVLLAVLAWLALVGSAVVFLRSRPSRRLLR